MSYVNRNKALKQEHSTLASETDFSLASPELHSTHASSMSSAWLRNHQSHKPTMVAYIRTSDGSPNYLDQAAEILEFCKLHNYQVSKFFEDQGNPSYGFTEAMEALKTQDGLIARDISTDLLSTKRIGCAT